MKYYHFDNDIYEEGDTIIEYYMLSKEIVDEYKKITSIDANSIVYMLDNEKKEYYESFDFCYLVEPVGLVFEGIMDYSPYICQMFIEDGDVTNHLPYSSEEIKEIIYSFANAYNNSEISKEVLLEKYKKPIDNKKEYICSSCKVIKIIK